MSQRILKSASVAGSLLFATVGLLAQQPAQPGSPAYTLRASSNLVIIDVVALGTDGKPAQGLKAEAFSVKEDGKPQVLRGFQEHGSAADQHAPVASPKLAAGLFTNYATPSQDGPSNVLLLDMLNTPLRDQAFARQQINDYLSKAPQGRIAIFGLSSGLTILQGFTSDPAILKAALNRKSSMSASPLLNDQLGGGGGDNAGATGLSDAITQQGNSPDVLEAVANAQQFEAETQSFQLQIRSQITLDALNELARYLSNIPGRKNLIWFSGSFPSVIQADSTLNNGFTTLSSSEAEFRDTMTLLARNQISLYPVDVRGLLTSGAFSASSSNQKYARDPSAIGKDIAAFDVQMAQENQTMLDAARETGGRAFVNTNGLQQAVSQAIDDGSHYYTLAYSPTNKTEDGKYRKVDIVSTRRDLTLSYRRGYYAEVPQASASAQPAPTQGGHPTDAGEIVLTRSMVRGAPVATQIQFTARVRLATGTPEPEPAAGNELAPEGKPAGPYLRYIIDLASDPKEFAFTQAEGEFHDAIRFVAYLYDINGNLVLRTGSTLRANLKATTYTAFLQRPLSYNLDLSAPVKGSYFLRLAIQDENSKRVGSIEVPLDSVRTLPPLGQPQASH